jgi:carboxymethylenebutenolidase
MIVTQDCHACLAKSTPPANLAIDQTIMSKDQPTMGDTITIAATGGGGEIPAYVAHPASPAKAAIIVIPEIFGVNEGIRRKVDDWAALGYLAIAPDIFWRFAPGVQLDPDVPEQLQEAFGYFQQYDADLGVEDITAVLGWTKAQGAGKTGLVGFCLGGRLAYMAATRTAIDAAVGYYGVMIDTMLGESANITRPLMCCISPPPTISSGPRRKSRSMPGLIRFRR